VPTTLEVYVNGDDALLRWRADDLDERCVGFAVQRERTRAGGAPETTWLDNYAPPGTAPHQTGTLTPSDEWPFRAFSWTDHGADAEDTVRYRAMPVLEGSGPNESDASAWSAPRSLRAAGPGSAYAAFFNRGFVISQFVSRILDERYPGVDRDTALRRFKADITDDTEDATRAFLAGDMRVAVLAHLDGVADGADHVYAALYELNDDELIRTLERLGPRAHVVLANGSVQQPTRDGHVTETAAEARRRDENAAARARLLAADVDVDARHRFVAPGSLAHNKFLVVATPDGEAKDVWTGSMNWTTTGLCTQLNNGLLVDHPAVAAAYLAQWHALRDAGSAHPPALTDANGTPTAVGGDTPGAIRASVHFTRARRRVDLAALGEIVDAATRGVLFLMFMPGGSGVLASVRALAAARPELLVRGVVSELPRGREDEHTGETTTLRVTLHGDVADGVAARRTEDVIQPEGMPHPAAGWAVETTRRQFLGNIGHAIIHSKVLVVDPFEADPVVVTGSHNFSISASEDNDENFIVVRGDRALAEAYAVNVQSAWRHYAGRMGTPHPDLTGVAFLRALQEDQRREDAFWRRAP
jgi:phosphatidylserine/phosphatidylglycerophosphate/cardiolipin synthase-like enzyme